MLVIIKILCMLSQSFGVTCSTEKQYKATQHFDLYDHVLKEHLHENTKKENYLEIINTSGNMNSYEKCEYII